MIDNVQQKNNSIQGKPEKKASLLLPIIVAAVIFVAMVVSICVSGSLKTMNIEIRTDSYTTLFQIDDVEAQNNALSISGWFFKLEENTISDDGVIVSPELRIVLMDMNTEEKCFLDTVSRIERKDINDYYLCEYDYTYCGFEAQIDSAKLNIDNGEYEILIVYDKTNNYAISTKSYVCNGKLTYTNPQNAPKLNVEGTDLQDVVENGALRVYRDDQGICIYQYDNKLYWIADDSFNFAADDKTYVQYQLTTTQPLKLPANRVDNGYTWDNIGDYFENHEITNEVNCGNYRVSVRDLPTEYAVSFVVTGYYEDNKWIWQEYFRPIHQIQ